MLLTILLGNPYIFTQLFSSSFNGRVLVQDNNPQPTEKERFYSGLLYINVSSLMSGAM